MHRFRLSPRKNNEGSLQETQGRIDVAGGPTKLSNHGHNSALRIKRAPKALPPPGDHRHHHLHAAPRDSSRDRGRRHASTRHPDGLGRVLAHGLSVYRGRMQVAHVGNLARLPPPGHPPFVSSQAVATRVLFHARRDNRAGQNGQLALRPPPPSHSFRHG